MKKIPTFFVIFSMLFIHASQAISLGTIPKNERVLAVQGETAEFTILFWNSGSSSYYVELEPKKIPEEWLLIARPEHFILHPTKPENPPYEEGEYMSLPDGIIKTFPVKILVKTSGSTEPGEYTISIIATAGNTGKDISILQQRVFKLKVDLAKNPTIFEKMAEPLRLIGKETTERSKNMGKKVSGAFSTVSTYPGPILLFVFLVAIFGLGFMYNKIKNPLVES